VSPDEEGIETQFPHLPTLAEKRWNVCPDEEGIETPPPLPQRVATIRWKLSPDKERIEIRQKAGGLRYAEHLHGSIIGTAP
jgi:hypothetical protein